MEGCTVKDSWFYEGVNSADELKISVSKTTIINKINLDKTPLWKSAV